MKPHPNTPALAVPVLDRSRPRLTLREKVGYSLGDLASNIYFQTFVVFLPIFYTDVFGLSAAAMGTMLLVTRIFDAVGDPLMGMIADRTRTRWGKFRPYIAGFAIPLAVGGVLAFTTPDLGETGKLVYAYVTYMLLVVFYTAVNVPYSALMGVITPSSVERTEVSTYRFVAAFIGQFIIGATALTLVDRLGGGDERLGWPYTMAVYGVLVAGLLLTTFFLTRERVQPTPAQQGRIGEDLKDLLRNRPWVLIGVATVFQLTYIVMRGSATPYYFRYFVQDQQLTLFGLTLDLNYTVFTSSFVTVGTVSTLIGAICTGLFTKRWDNKSIYSGFLIASALLSVLFFPLAPENVLLIYGLNVLLSFFFGSVSVLQWAIYTDTADYGAWKFGRRATGLIMAASLFMLKLGLTFGGALVGWILGLHGFEAGTAQSETALFGIRLLMSFYPALFGIAGGLIMLAYPLTGRMMLQIEADLTRRSGEDAPLSSTP
ncbi:MFS transporter [Rhodocaloribacter litoris]|uniref:MFS transporter n=1 Tax=Rhodocaloribacter litoris TaxID=2558931 RepID=UPI00142423FF|nr:MFS transporter [Rhodocaloribacter litoris]QXD14812.1 MFS transporter [Rhodocaloribacter litoris]